MLSAPLGEREREREDRKGEPSWQHTKFLEFGKDEVIRVRPPPVITSSVRCFMCRVGVK